jgi:hypothetical protein
MPFDVEQVDLFPPPAHHALVDRLAEQFKAELSAMARAAVEEIDRAFAFSNRSQAQKRRFARYRQLIAQSQGASK